MADRVTIIEATHILDMTQPTVRMAASNRGWKSEMVGKGRNKKRMFLRSDIEALAAERKANYTPIKFDRPSKSEEVRGHVEWADSLTKWPSDKAIEARTSEVYRKKDLESVLDVRVFRKVDGKYLEPLRQPAMRVLNSRGKLIAG